MPMNTGDRSQGLRDQPAPGQSPVSDGQGWTDHLQSGKSFSVEKHPVKEAETQMQVTMTGAYVDYRKRRSDTGQAEIKILFYFYLFILQCSKIVFNEVILIFLF